MQEIEKITKIIPRELVNIGLTRLNYPEIVLNVQELTLTKEGYKKLKEIGYDVSWGCFAGCGFADFEKYEEEDKVTFVIYPCQCHPFSYYIVLVPIK